MLLCGSLAASEKDSAPSSPATTWSSPRLDYYERDLANLASEPHAGAPVIDLSRVYTLPELIDIAQRANPNTRVAWERARQAAAAIGLAQSAYFPFLAASAGAGYEEVFIPFPALKVGPAPQIVSITGGGTLSTDIAAERAALGVKWLLFDFGARKAEVAVARERLMTANVGFNAVHQQIVHAVTRRFYELNSTREKVKVAERSVASAEVICRAAQARFEHGLATRPEMLQADQQVAQARFELESASGALSDAQVALAESLGILPTPQMQIAQISAEPYGLADSLESLISRALSQRPDLVAKLAKLRAARADLKQAQAAYYPRIGVNAHVGGTEMDVSIKSSPFFGGSGPEYGGGLFVEVPIFDGFLRRNKVKLAQSELRAAQAELEEARDSATREVWKAYTDLQTAIRKQESADKLLVAAETAFAAALEAYKNGVGTYIDTVNAERNVTAARSAGVDTRAAIFTGAATLALSVGDLARPQSHRYPVSHHD